MCKTTTYLFLHHEEVLLVCSDAFVELASLRRGPVVWSWGCRWRCSMLMGSLRERSTSICFQTMFGMCGDPDKFKPTPTLHTHRSINNGSPVFCLGLTTCCKTPPYSPPSLITLTPTNLHSHPPTPTATTLTLSLLQLPSPWGKAAGCASHRSTVGRSRRGEIFDTSRGKAAARTDKYPEFIWAETRTFQLIMSICSERMNTICVEFIT